MRCNLVRRGELCICQVCGQHFAWHDCDALDTICQKIGIGDRLERGLAKVGISQSGWIKAKIALGLPPSCGCEDRKNWLNKATAWWLTNKGE